MAVRKPFDFLYLLIVPIAAGIDLYSKHLAAVNLKPYLPVKIIGNFLRFTLVYNRGITFGILNKGRAIGSLFIVIIIFSAAGLFFIILLYRRALAFMSGRAAVVIAKVSMMLVAGGAAGNITDRVLHKAVIDFIDIGAGSLRWYTFNLADSFLLLGGITLAVVFAFFEDTRESGNKN